MGRFFLALLVVLGGLFIAGELRGWFDTETNGNGSSTPSLTLTVDKDKVKQDNQKIEQGLQNAGNDVKNLVTSTTQPSAK